MFDPQPLYPIFDAFIKDMRTNLARPILKKRRNGSTYQASTNATGRLSESLRRETLETPDTLTILVRGTDYWRNADAGKDPLAPPPTIPDLAAWAIAKNVDIPENILKAHLEIDGPNRPPSGFVRGAAPLFFFRLDAAIRTGEVVRIDETIDPILQPLLKFVGR